MRVVQTRMGQIRDGWILTRHGLGRREMHGEVWREGGGTDLSSIVLVSPGAAPAAHFHHSGSPLYFSLSFSYAHRYRYFIEWKHNQDDVIVNYFYNLFVHCNFAHDS